MYLKKEYSNLITADFACHGAPRREVWSRYLEEEIENHKTAQRVVVGKSTVSSSLNLMSLIEDIKFREKSDGWKKFRFVLKFDEPS
ncbi:UNVERIFIED_CONTAM: F420H(2):quinone oxidoreductase, partial [Bacteroidetes bacterium 56_B9]